MDQNSHLEPYTPHKYWKVVIQTALIELEIKKYDKIKEILHGLIFMGGMIMNNSIRLNHEEKLKLLPHVGYLLNIISKARQSGIFSVENEIKDSEDEFFQIAFKLVCGGHNPEYVKRTLKNLVNSSYTDNVDQVKKLIQADILPMMEVHPNHFINMSIFSYFGISFKTEYQEGLKKLLTDSVYQSIFDDDGFII